MKQPDFVLRGEQVVMPSGIEAHDIVISDGKIKSVAAHGSQTDLPVVEAGSLTVMPALVDSHVHINEPGRTEWEGFISATQAAAAGGIGMLCDMPLNCIPVTTSVAALQAKREAVQNKLWVDCGFYGGVVPGNAHELEPMIEAGVLGFKCFLIHSGIDDFPNVTEEELRQAMPILAKHKMPLLVHAELDFGGHAQTKTVGNEREYQTYLASRPRQWEVDAIELMIRLCRETGCPVHIVHLSCADALPMIAKARKEGLPLTVETCSHYLTLQAETVPDGATLYKCAPPIREQENADRLWQGLKDGVIDFIVSDHSPCTPELKKLESGNFDEAWGGISSLQFGLPIVWSEAKKRGFNLQDLIRLQCSGPAQLIGQAQRKGAIKPGYDADFVLWDPNAPVTIEPAINRHRHKKTPYDGKMLHGRVDTTFVRGQIVYANQQPSQTPLGQPVFHRAKALTKGTLSV